MTVSSQIVITLLIGLSVTFSIQAHGQESEQDTESGYEDPSSPEPGTKDISNEQREVDEEGSKNQALDQLSEVVDTESRSKEPSKLVRNPNDIPVELEKIYKFKDTLLVLPDYLKWRDFKDYIYRKIGLRFSISYFWLYQQATGHLSRSQAAEFRRFRNLDLKESRLYTPGKSSASSAIFDFQGKWSLFPETSTPGTIAFKLDKRHRVSSSTYPFDLAEEIGSGWKTADSFNRRDFSLTQLWWQQLFFKDRVGFRVGKMGADSIYDFTEFKSARHSFLNGAFSINSSIAFPTFGPGAAGLLKLSEEIYILSGIHNASQTSKESSFNSFFEESEHFIAGELGMDLDKKARGNYHITAWHTDKDRNGIRPRGWGITAHGEQRFGNIKPFVRYGYSNKDAARLKSMVNAGVGILDVLGQDTDVIGFGFSWGKPTDGDLDSQMASEVFYRTQMTQFLTVTPSFQAIINPAFHPSKDLIGVFGLRFRMAF